jgi:aerobic carbon-monoxide dehydrogenase medium subunit
VKPAPFRYHAPESINDACSVLSEYGDEAKPLAGGQSLVPMLALRLTRFEHLVDLNRVSELAGVRHELGHVVVGACTRQRVMERDAVIARDLPLVARATPLIGHFQIRNRGTVGGSLAHADPASEYPALALALGAEFELVGSKGARRCVAADDFFVGTWTTILGPEELLSAVQFPIWGSGCGYAIEEVARRHGDFALAGVACAVGPGRAGLALFGVASTPVRAAPAEQLLSEGATADEVAEAAVRDLAPPTDVHASGATRLRIARHLVVRAVERARSEAAR